VLYLTKKFSEITLAKFLKQAEKKDTEHILQDEYFGILNVMKQEGFTEDEALGMDVKKAWEFYINCLINNPSKVIHRFYFASEVGAENAPVMRSYLKKITELYKELEKDFDDEGSSLKNDNG
jgi:uncharacterized protein YdaT